LTCEARNAPELAQIAIWSFFLAPIADGVLMLGHPLSRGSFHISAPLSASGETYLDLAIRVFIYSRQRRHA
jgi:hypothetical protein